MEDLVPKLAVLVLLTLINAFFAAAEIAVISLSETRLRKQVQEGDRTAERLLRLMLAPDDFLSAIQIAITLAGFLSSAIAADSFSDPLVQWITQDLQFTLFSPAVLNGVMVVIITIVLSYFSLVLGELVPKRIAMKKTEAVARLAVGPVCGMASLFRPVIWLLSRSTNGVLRLFRVDPAPSGDAVGEEDIRMMVNLGEEKGSIAPSEKELINNIFSFKDTTARDVMVHRTDMAVLRLEDSPDVILDTIRSTGRSRFPVCRENADRIAGILSSREYLLNAQLRKPRPLEELLRPAHFVPETARTDLLFREMQRNKLRMVIVADEYGGTSGLITMEDLLEQIVGSIYDEFDPQEPQEIQQVQENLWRVAGTCSLEHMFRELHLPLPEDAEADTLGGLVFSRLTVIPEEGSSVEVEACGLRIQVKPFHGRRVESALVSLLPQCVSQTPS